MPERDNRKTLSEIGLTARALATTFNTNRTYINEAARLKQGREKQKESGKLYGENHQKQEVLSIIDKTSEEEPHNTRNIISSEIGKSTAPTVATAN